MTTSGPGLLCTASRAAVISMRWLVVAGAAPLAKPPSALRPRLRRRCRRRVIGAAYAGALHALEAGLWPTHWSTGAHVAVMMAVGLAVGLITRFVGTPGDVELLVNNIHVLGGPEDV